jgi:glycosyltransferase involved in cell wall biosynthesis
LTATGFGVARYQDARSPASTPTSAPMSFRPALVTTADLDVPSGLLDTASGSGERYERAIVLVRQGGRPCGVAEVEIPVGGLDAAECEDRLREALGRPVPSAAHDQESHPLFSVASVFPTLPHVTVVVATRDRPEDLRRCVDSVLASNYPSFDVLVVDNAPASIATQRVVADTYGAGQPVQYVREATPGLACAHNRALLETTGPIVAFTDDDVLVDPDWIANLVAGFGVAPDVACVTGMIFPLEIETPAQDLVERSIGFNKGFEQRLFRLGGPHDDLLFPYAAGRFGSGANMAFRTDVLSALGGFDPALGTGTKARGGDDLAAFFDVVASGHALVYEPAAVIFHAHRRDDSALARQAFGYGAGLTAYLTKTLVDRPARVLDLAARVPAGLRYAFSRTSPKNARLPVEYPTALVRRERAGMLAGPALYWRSRRATRHAPRPARGNRPDPEILAVNGRRGS